MCALKRSGMLEQACEYIRREAASSDWGDRLPTVRRLSKDLGIAQNTVLAAIRKLDTEGFFKGSGRDRRIDLTKLPAKKKGAARVAIIPRLAFSESSPALQRSIARLRHHLEAEGRIVIITRPQDSFDEDRGALMTMIGETGADLLIVFDAPHDLLEGLSRRGRPVLAVGGASSGLPVSSLYTDAGEATGAAVAALCNAGHRRIVFVTEQAMRERKDSRMTAAYRAALKQAGVTPGRYNMPDWEETPEGLRDLLKELFRITPPTALILSDHRVLLGTWAFLMERGLRVPADVSLVALEPDDIEVAWMLPEPGRIAVNYDSLGDMIQHWVESVSIGGAGPVALRQDALFFPGATIGPARAS
jgi:DNA-binding LacI/PurR family transcriptional regulator